jgi:ribosomal-protein-serine acetyltransferase
MKIRINDNSFLELINESHALQIFDIVTRDREYLGAWLPWIYNTHTIEDTKSFINNCIDQHLKADALTFAIKHCDELKGVISLHRIDHNNRSTSIGYWLGKNYQGKGLMTSATRSLVDHCFTSLLLNRVEIRCATENQKSQAIPIRLKFKKEGTLRKAELLRTGFVDHDLFSALKEEWPI